MTERSNVPSNADLLMSFGAASKEEASVPVTGDSPHVAAKKAAVQQTALQKMANYGGPAEQRVIATAMAQGNRLAEDAGLQDLDLDPLSYIEKYGLEAFQNRGRIHQARLDLQRLKNAERGTGDMLKDAAIDVGIGAMNTLGGAAVLGVNASEQMAREIGNLAGIDVPAISPYLSMGLGWAGEKLHEQQSSLMQERRKQLELQASLNRVDNEAAYQEDLADNAGAESAWDSAVAPWFKKQGRAFGGTVENYAADPMMLGSLGAEGVGSLLPVTMAAKLAKAGGMAAEKAAALTIGATESGAAISQTQQQIMSMSEEDLSKSEDYQTLRRMGLDHEDAQILLARDAGTAAGLMAAPGALMAGKIAAPFAASPVASAVNPLAIARNISRETVEETIQEANTQVASNAAMDKVAGIETALDEGVAEAAAMGAMGGAMASGALQAPGAAAVATSAATGVAGKAAGAAVKGAKAAIRARSNAIEAEIDSESVVGSQAREAAAEGITTAGREILESLGHTVPNHTAPQEEEEEKEEGEPAGTTEEEPTDLGGRIAKGLFLSPEEAGGYAGRYGRVRQMREANPDAPLPRAHAILAAEDAFRAEDVDEVTRFDAALDAVRAFDEMMQARGTVAQQEIEALPEDHRARKAFDTLSQHISVLESSPVMAEARQVLNDLTPEKVAEFVPLDLLETGNDMEKMAVGQMLETIALVNPMAVPRQTYDDVLDQIGGIGKPGRKILEQNLALARSIVEEFAKADEARAKIQANYDQVIEGLEKKPSKPFKTWDAVREEINTGGNNDNSLPSLEEHRKRIVGALRTGRLESAQDALEDLKNFAQHQINKVGAYNASADTPNGDSVSFQAYGPFGWFQNEKGVYANTRSPESMAMIREAVVDTQAAVNLHNLLLKSLSLALKEQAGPELKVPDLHPKLSAGKPATQAPVPTPASAPVQDAAPAPAPAPAKRKSPKKPKKPKKAVAEKETPPEEATNPEELEEEASDENAEETQEEEEVIDEGAVAATRSWFDGLKERLYAAANEANHFLNSFRPGRQGSLLHTVADPVGHMLENLSNLARPGVNGMVRELTDDEQEAVRQLLVSETGGLPTFRDMLEDALLTRLDRKPKNGGPTWLERMEDGEDVQGYDNGLLLNFMAEREEGMIEVEPRVVTATWMAAAEWLIQNLSGPRSMSEEEISKLFGQGRNGHVSDRMKMVARFGTNHQTVVEEISRKIGVLLGVDPKSDVTISKTQGMLKSLAANALDVMLEQGMIEVNGRDGAAWNPETLGKNGKPLPIGTAVNIIDQQTNEPAKRTMVMIRASEAAKDPNGAFAVLKTARDPFTRFFTKAQERDRYIGEAPKKIQETQIGNDFALISPLARKVIRRLNRRPSYVNEPLLSLVDALGEDAYKALLGYVKLTPESEKRYSKAHLESIKGKNQSLDRGLAETRGYIEEARLYGQAKKIPLGEVKIFHQHAISSVGRLQQQGPITPQNDKTARELISTTFSTIDLEKPQHMEAFWLAVAQSIGMKVEKEPHLPEEGGSLGVLQDVQKIFRDENGLLPAVNNIREFLRTGVLKQSELLNTIWVGQDAKGKGFEPTAKLLHALLTVAQLEEARAKGEKTLRTALALEADGRTDGPVNAMIHMGTGLFRTGGKLLDGGFTPDEIKRFAKGGLFFTDEPLSLNDYIAAEWRKNPQMQRGEDLYHMAAKRFEEVLKRMYEGGAEAGAYQVMNFLDAFHKDFRLGKDIERGLVKNPLTVFLYGSSVKGIAGKIAGEALAGFYRSLSEALAARADGKIQNVLEHSSLVPHDGFLAEFQSLTGVDLKARLAQNPEEFELSPTEFERMVKKVEEFFAEPMAEAIDETTGGLASSMQLTQKAASVQTAVFKDILNQKMAERSKDLPKGELLSEKEMRAVFAEAMSVAPIYGTDGETFHISAPRKAPEGKEITSSLKSRFSSKARELRGSDASVKVSPYMTIGTGDGRMILNIYVNGDGALEASLPVFDGVEQAIADVDRASTQINAAVFEGWTGQNLYRSLADGYWQMLSKLDQKAFDALSEGTLREISEALGLRNSDGKLVRPRLAHLREVHQDLENRALISEARKVAIRAMPTQTDHMAGARKPYGRKGTVEWKGGPLDFDGIARTLNGVFRTELQRLVEAAAEAGRISLDRRSYAQPESQAMKNLVAQIGEAVPGHEGVYRLKGEQLLPLISEATEASPEHVSLFWDVLMKDPAFKEAIYYFGDATTLEDVRDEFHDNLPKHPIQLGQAHPGAGVVFVANQSPETLLHEMLHTHTLGRLAAHYDHPEGSPPYIRDAVARLEALAQEVMEIDPEMAGDAAPALMTLQSDMARLSASRRKAAVISELISYVLTNQELTSLARKKKTYGPLMRVIRKGLVLLQRLLGIKSVPGDTLFSNIRFNTEVLLANPTAEGEVAAQNTRTDELVNQAYGENPRLASLERKFLGRLQEHLEASRPKDPGKFRVNELEFQHKIARLRTLSRKASEAAIAHHFDMDQRQAHAFEAIHSAMLSGMRLDPVLMRQANQAYAHVTRNLTEGALLKAENAGEPPTRDALERASKRLEFLTSAKGLRSTAEGQTDLLATFVALAQVDDVLRAAMSEMVPPKLVDVKRDSVDGAVESLSNSAVNLLTNLSLKRVRQPRTVQEQLDVLASGLAEIEGDRRFAATMRLLNETMDRLNETMASGIKWGSDRASDWLNQKAKGTSNRYARAGLSAAAMVTALGSKEASLAHGEALTTILNHAKGFHETRALLNDMRGMTESNAQLLRLVNRVRAHVDALRQDYREAIPEELAKRFSRKLTKGEWTAMFNGIGRTDLMAIGLKDAQDLMKSPGSLARMIQKEEERLAAVGGAFAPRYKAKAKALAIYMVKRQVTSINLLRNAHAIAHLFGEQGADAKKIEAGISKDLLDAISRLTSLYAYEQLDEGTRKSLKHLAETEATGLETLAGFYRSIRQAELDRRTRHGLSNEVAFNNGWKGYVPSVTQEGASIIVRDDLEQADLVKQGYVRIGDYKGDAREDYPGKRGYYQSAVSGRNAFRQGVAQTVHDTWQGVDARNGTTLHGETAGKLLGPKVDRLARKAAVGKARNDGLRPADYLLPVFNTKGTIVAYERPMDPERMAGLKRDTHLGRMMGVWLGRILEEEAADQFNRELVDKLKEIWEAEKDTRGVEFINVADKKLDDPVIRDAWKTLGWKIKADAAQSFGKADFLPIRRDMVNDAIGFRAAGVTDFWTGNSRWSPKQQEAARDFLTLVLGKKAFEKVVKAETVVGDLVSYAKTTIVVRSIVVAGDNILSNMLHLSLYGIGPIEIAKAGREKFLEINEYVKNQREMKTLEIDLAAAVRKPVERRKIEARMKVLEEINARMSIRPLIEAGEFSTISESLTEADVAIREGRWADYLESATDRLPSWAGVVAKNALVTKDTALFKGLNRMVQYGDFVAKAVLYDHLTQQRGMGKDEALDALMEEFVQYNRLPGRGRDFAESMGLLWFFNYKLRITKIALKMWRENPLRSLLLMGGAGPMAGVDTVWSGSLLGKGLEGGLGYAFGPEMGINALALNPWYNFSN